MRPDIRSIRIADYDYPLPEERIAKHPLAQREQCKLLCWLDGAVSDRIFADLPGLLPDGTMLVYNNTRVINARLRFTKPSGGAIEIFCLEPISPADYERVFQSAGSCTWLCLVGNSKRWKDGALAVPVNAGGRALTFTATRGERRGNAWEITFVWDAPDVTFATLLDATGEIPIPPYLNRATEQTDATDYQTVYSHVDGSVAAPTAGLHFTDELLAACDRRGIVRRELTLHVGAGTFQPVKSERISDHPMHSELFRVPLPLIDELAAAERPVVAVGTTTVRTLESLYYIGQTLADTPDTDTLAVEQWAPYTTEGRLSTAEALHVIAAHLRRTGQQELVASTRLMIAPGFRWRLVNGMVTNFHQPQSTLLLLVSALLGGDRWRTLYRHALDADYRFLSYGDACLFMRDSEDTP